MHALQYFLTNPVILFHLFKYYGAPQLSRLKEIVHGEKKLLWLYDVLGVSALRAVTVPLTIAALQTNKCCTAKRCYAVVIL